MNMGQLVDDPAREVSGRRAGLRKNSRQAIQAVGNRRQNRRVAGLTIRRARLQPSQPAPPQRGFAAEGRSGETNDHGRHCRSTPKKTFKPTRKSAGARAAATTPFSPPCRSVFAELGVRREKFVFISGIGCSSRFPYYMNTFGFHTIHGRAPAIATGLKLVAPRSRRLGRHR